MTRYDPLTQHLRQRQQAQIAMTFPDLERLLGFSLPPSARKHRAWWSNNPSNHVQTKAWLAAGYQSQKVDLAAERLIFAKLNAAEKGEGIKSGEEFAALKPRHRHPLFGCMVGTITIMPGVDLTEPTAPGWDEMVLEKAYRLLERA